MVIKKDGQLLIVLYMEQSLLCEEDSIYNKKCPKIQVFEQLFFMFSFYSPNLQYGTFSKASTLIHSYRIICYICAKSFVLIVA